MGTQVQRDALCSILKDLQLTPEAKASFCTSILAVKWHGNDVQHVLLVMSPPGCLPPGKRRRQQQSWEHVVFYGKDTDWDVLTSQTSPSMTKLELIVKIAVGLGMRCPSEPTLKFLCSWWLVCSHTAEDLCKPGSCFDSANCTWDVWCKQTANNRLGIQFG
jgi:hypothetical protein